MTVCADTHALIWYIFDDPRLSKAAAAALDAAATRGRILVPSICLVELTYLIEKSRIAAAVRDRVNEILDSPNIPCSLILLDRRVAAAVESISRKDMPDRIIAATAMSLQAPLVSCDSRIRASQLQTIW